MLELPGCVTSLVAVAVRVGVLVMVGLGVCVSVGVAVSVGVGVKVLVGVEVRVGVCVQLPAVEVIALAVCVDLASSDRPHPETEIAQQITIIHLI